MAVGGPAARGAPRGLRGRDAALEPGGRRAGAPPGARKGRRADQVAHVAARRARPRRQLSVCERGGQHAVGGRAGARRARDGGLVVLGTITALCGRWRILRGVSSTMTVSSSLKPWPTLPASDQIRVRSRIVSHEFAPELSSTLYERSYSPKAAGPLRQPAPKRCSMIGTALRRCMLV